MKFSKDIARQAPGESRAARGAPFLTSHVLCWNPATECAPVCRAPIHVLQGSRAQKFAEDDKFCWSARLRYAAEA